LKEGAEQLKQWSHPVALAAAAVVQFDWSCASEVEDWQQGSPLMDALKIQTTAPSWQTPNPEVVVGMKLRVRGGWGQPRGARRSGYGCKLLLRCCESEAEDWEQLSPLMDSLKIATAMWHEEISNDAAPYQRILGHERTWMWAMMMTATSFLQNSDFHAALHHQQSNR
jgi:hypothetical protein